jgi:hypothetical protein
MYGLTEQRSVIFMKYPETEAITEKRSAIPRRATREAKRRLQLLIIIVAHAPRVPYHRLYQTRAFMARVCVRTACGSRHGVAVHDLGRPLAACITAAKRSPTVQGENYAWRACNRISAAFRYFYWKSIKSWDIDRKK